MEGIVDKTKFVVHLLKCGAETKDFDDKHHHQYMTGQIQKRGGEDFYQPSNCWKIALSVSGRFDDGDGWLDSATGWPCAFHGTPSQNVIPIIRSGLLINGGAPAPRHGAVYGKGVYISPKMEVCMEAAFHFFSF
jgi:hypothetical protein